MARTLTTPEQHAVRIAQQTMRYGCGAARAIFGTSHADARETLQAYGRYQRGPDTHLPADCTCVD